MNEFPKEKILSLDDNAMRDLIMEINTLAGGNPKNAEKLAADIPSLKNRISKMSDKDAKKLLNKIESDKAEEILNKIKNK